MSFGRKEEALPGLGILEQTPIIIEKIVASASDEQLQWKPAPERWSISEVLAHLGDVEVAVFRGRLQAMAEKDSPMLKSYDQDAAYAAGKYSGGNGRENLKQFCHERDRSLSFLRYVSTGILARGARHPELGALTGAHILNIWAFHDLGHIRQISELYRARAFYPALGPYQRYVTNLKP
jgi:DinB superfamily